MSNDYILQFKKGSVNSKMYFNRHTLLTFLCAVILVVSSQKTNGSQLDRQVSFVGLNIILFFILILKYCKCNINHILPIKGKWRCLKSRRVFWVLVPRLKSIYNDPTISSVRKVGKVFGNQFCALWQCRGKHWKFL